MCLFISDSVLRHYNNQLSKEKSSYVGLSELQRKRMEEVLLDGDLLEVTTDETTQLWQVHIYERERVCGSLEIFNIHQLITLNDVWIQE